MAFIFRSQIQELAVHDELGHIALDLLEGGREFLDERRGAVGAEPAVGPVAVREAVLSGILSNPTSFQPSAVRRK